jgi:hypothetical protein
LDKFFGSWVILGKQFSKMGCFGCRKGKMSQLLNVGDMLREAGIKRLGLTVIGSSHVKRIKTGTKRYHRKGKAATRGKELEQLRAGKVEQTLPEGTNVFAWGGLSLAESEFSREPGDLKKLPQKGKIRVNQARMYGRRVKDSADKVFLNITGSNDFKDFFVENGKLAHLSMKKAAKWRKMPLERQVRFHPKKADIFSKASEDFMKERVKVYIKTLVGYFKKSSCVHMFHSSLLERHYPDVEAFKDLDVYFAHVNFLIKFELESLNKGEGVRNRDNVTINWYFINVSKQFLECDYGNRFSLFEESDLRYRVGVHRNGGCMDKLVKQYLMEIYETLTSKGILREVV